MVLADRGLGLVVRGLGSVDAGLRLMTEVRIG